jgi:hypothetical protein
VRTQGRLTGAGGAAAPPVLPPAPALVVADAVADAAAAVAVGVPAPAAPAALVASEAPPSVGALRLPFFAMPAADATACE